MTELSGRTALVTGGGTGLGAAIARELDIELIATGTELYGVAPVADPLQALGPISDGDAVLVKASRVAGLEKIADALLV